jgi:hypothetical protein
VHFDIGQPVWWNATSNNVSKRKFGYIYARVPSNMNPRDLVPKNMFFSSKSEYRPKDSYFIRIPRIAICYWPEQIFPLDKEEEIKCYTQDTPRGLIYPGSIANRSDREKLKFIFELAGDEYMEREAYLVNVSTCTRYWFWGEDGVEYVKNVEKFKLVL